MARRCVVADCDSPHEAKGYCRKHYRRWKAYGDPNGKYVRQVIVKSECKVLDCAAKEHSGGYCYRHYMNNYRNGHPYSIGELHEIFICGVVAVPTNNCVIWPFGKKDNGYGITNYIEQAITAHRAALILYTGENPKDKLAAHGPCHNRLCINPHSEHGMGWSDKRSNALDQYRDGTMNRSLTNEQISEVRKRYLQGEKLQSIGDRYGVTATTVCYVAKGKTYQHLNLSRLERS